MDNLDKIIAKIIEEAEIKSRSIAELSRKMLKNLKIMKVQNLNKENKKYMQIMKKRKNLL